MTTGSVHGGVQARGKPPGVRTAFWDEIITNRGEFPSWNIIACASHRLAEFWKKKSLHFSKPTLCCFWAICNPRQASHGLLKPRSKVLFLVACLRTKIQTLTIKVFNSAKKRERALNRLDWSSGKGNCLSRSKSRWKSILGETFDVSDLGNMTEHSHWLESVRGASYR